MKGSIAMKPYLESIELSCAMHCNLSCRGCSHASPLEVIRWIDVEKTVRCLKLLHEVIDIGVIRFIGGEPTLYNELEVLVSKNLRNTSC